MCTLYTYHTHTNIPSFALGSSSVAMDFTTLLTVAALLTVEVFCFCSRNCRAISNALPFVWDVLAALLLFKNRR